MKGHGCKDWAKGTSLGIAFNLPKEVTDAITGSEVTLGSLSIESVKEWDHALELRIVGQGVTDGLPGTFIEHVAKVQEKEKSGGGRMANKVPVEL